MNLKKAAKYLVFDIHVIISCLATFYFICFVVETVIVGWYVVKNLIRQLLQVSFRASLQNFKQQWENVKEDPKDE